jgi:hypothetical protein
MIVKTYDEEYEKVKNNEVFISRCMDRWLYFILNIKNTYVDMHILFPNICSYHFILLVLWGHTFKMYPQIHYILQVS